MSVKGTNFFPVGERVEMHPATDLWMRGAKFGTVVDTSRIRPFLWVKLDRLRGRVRVHPDNLILVQ